jgi:2-polyprenyl-3-methyl-5-hydroxy-6-metoxy-1,4-benzoquinol methylase
LHHAGLIFRAITEGNAMADQTQFWNRLADKYAAQPVADPASYQTKLEATRSLLGPDMDVFEFGCGTGSTALAHAPHVRHILATDFSQRMVEIARDKARRAGITNVSFEQADIATMAAPSARYDMVMGHSILHLLSDPQQAIDASYSMLRPGGHLVTSTACLSGTAGLVLGIVGPLGKRFGLLPTLTAFSAERLKAMHRQSGFEIEKVWQPRKGAAVFIIARKPF